MVLSAQIEIAVTTAYIDAHDVFALAMLRLRQGKHLLQRTLSVTIYINYLQRKLLSSFRYFESGFKTLPK